MRFSIRIASSFALATIAIACGGAEPPPAPPPPKAALPPPVISIRIPLEDAGAPVAADPPPFATPSIVAKRQGTIRALAVDGRWTYWLTEDGDVKRAPSSGGPALKVEGFGGAASGLVVFGGKMYISAADPKSKGFSLLRVDPDLANKPDVVMTQTGTSAFLAADRAHVLWGTATGKRLSLVLIGNDVKGVKRLEPLDALTPTLLALAPSNAVYLDGHDARTPLLAGKNDPKKPLGFTITDGDIRALGVAANRIFFAVAAASSDADHENVYARPVEGGVIDLVAKDQANVTSFVGDDAAVYWSARGTKAAGFADGKIMKANPRTNEATVIVDKQHAPTKLALDAENVTWTNDNDEGSAADTDVLRVAR